MGERWRVGGKLKRTLYRDEQLVGLVDTGEIAAEIVETMNRVGRLLDEVRPVDGNRRRAAESGRERSPDRWSAAREVAVAEAVDATKDCTCGPFGGCDG
jgi:hypothetical protein